jgi:hypothetical protein
MSARLFIVMLRQPRKDDPRTDPFWEFGSFGCTGCHGKNLLHPKNCQIADGDRLAFVQGGHLGSRLLLVTPPIERCNHAGGSPNGRVELRWDFGKRPFRYDCAPSLFESPSPRQLGLFPKLVGYVAGADRTTIAAKFASRFRARTRPIEPEFARELVKGFKASIAAATSSDFISQYYDALPWCDCPRSSSDRRADYQRLRRGLKHATPPRTCRMRTTLCHS